MKFLVRTTDVASLSKDEMASTFDIAVARADLLQQGTLKALVL